MVSLEEGDSEGERFRSVSRNTTQIGIGQVTSTMMIRMEERNSILHLLGLLIFTK
jgi:hypothetical protein